jgi:hyperosmotically inducible periplasmic protein
MGVPLLGCWSTRVPVRHSVHLLTFIVFICGTPVLAAQGGSTADQQLKARVEQRLADRRLRGIKVAAVREGTITLEGPVGSVGAKQDLIADVLKVDGVKEVVSELTIAKAESDQRLAERVADQMRRSTYFTVFDEVQIGVDNGVVTLTGFVTQPIKSDDLARRASHVDGAREFVNKLEVLPASGADDRLRAIIANTLYRDPAFSNYASQAIPPVHIIVRNSSVLLTGVVNSEVERRQAENIVRHIPGIIGVQNALRVER